MTTDTMTTGKRDVITSFTPAHGTATTEGWSAVVGVLHEHALVDDESGSEVHAPMTLAGKTVLLAADGSEEAAAATRFALALASTHRARIHALSVLDSRATPATPALEVAMAMDDVVADAQDDDAGEESIVRTIFNVLGYHVEWPVRYAVGAPADAIAREAEHERAALVVAGLRPPVAIERALHIETMVRVMRTVACPVLVVPRSMSGLPARALAAIDFGRASLEAARCARSLLRPGGTLVLAYVAPMSYHGAEDGESLIHEAGVQARFASAVDELRGDDVEIEWVELRERTDASVARVLLDYATSEGIPLVAAGNARHGRLDRWLFGSVATDLVHEARCALLVVPPPADDASAE